MLPLGCFPGLSCLSPSDWPVSSSTPRLVQSYSGISQTISCGLDRVPVKLSFWLVVNLLGWALNKRLSGSFFCIVVAPFDMTSGFPFSYFLQFFLYHFPLLYSPRENIWGNISPCTYCKCDRAIFILFWFDKQFKKCYVLWKYELLNFSFLYLNGV